MQLHEFDAKYGTELATTHAAARREHGEQEAVARTVARMHGEFMTGYEEFRALRELLELKRPSQGPEDADPRKIPRVFDPARLARYGDMMIVAGPLLTGTEWRDGEQLDRCKALINDQYAKFTEWHTYYSANVNRIREAMAIWAIHHQRS